VYGCLRFRGLPYEAREFLLFSNSQPSYIFVISDFAAVLTAALMWYSLIWDVNAALISLPTLRESLSVR